LPIKYIFTTRAVLPGRAVFVYNFPTLIVAHWQNKNAKEIV
jgi:hypothetical protein